MVHMNTVISISNLSHIKEKIAVFSCLLNINPVTFDG